MKFYYDGCCGDGYFSERNLIKAIYTAWNVDADLWLLNSGIKKIDKYLLLKDQATLIFVPAEGNEFNSDLLESFGYYMIDGFKWREIRRLDNNKVVKYDWSDVKQLI